MQRLLLFLLFIDIHSSLPAQSLDLISVRKKNGRIIKTFTPGAQIVFETNNSAFIEGPVEAIKNDSIFIRIYDIRIVPTLYGFGKRDTISKYIFGLHYKEIKRIKVFKRHRFVRGKVDRLLIYGGAGYFVLNVINPALSNQPITTKENLQTLGLSAGAFGLGMIIKKYFYVNRFSRKWHKIIYIDVP